MENTDKIRELAAALSGIILVIAMCVLSALGRDIPPSLAGLAGMAFTWLFIRSAQQAEHIHADTIAARQAQKE